MNVDLWGKNCSRFFFNRRKGITQHIKRIVYNKLFQLLYTFFSTLKTFEQT